MSEPEAGGWFKKNVIPEKPLFSAAAGKAVLSGTQLRQGLAKSLPIA
jgi:hypothetical protein